MEENNQITYVKPLSDALLSGFVATVNHVESMEIGILLNVKGQIVSGLLVSASEYYKGVIKEFKEAGEFGESVAQVVEQFQEAFGSKKNEEDNGDNYSLPNFIHLKNAKYYSPGQEPLPTNRGVWWRGNLSSIDGYSFGSLGPKIE